MQQLASMRVPELDQPVASARSEALARGAVGYTKRRAFMRQTWKSLVLEPSQVVPFPVAQLGRTFLQQLLHAAQVVCRPFALGQGDAR